MPGRIEKTVFTSDFYVSAVLKTTSARQIVDELYPMFSNFESARYK